MSRFSFSGGTSLKSAGTGVLGDEGCVATSAASQARRCANRSSKATGSRAGFGAGARRDAANDCRGWKHSAWNSALLAGGGPGKPKCVNGTKDHGSSSFVRTPARVSSRSSTDDDSGNALNSRFAACSGPDDLHQVDAVIESWCSPSRAQRRKNCNGGSPLISTIRCPG